MSRVENVAHNLLARLGNAATLIKFSDLSYTPLEFLFRLAKANSLERVELEVVTGVNNLPTSSGVEKIVEDLSSQLDTQLGKLGVKQTPKACHIQLFFDLNSEVPVCINNPASNCIGTCNIQLD